MKFGTLHQLLNPFTFTWPKSEIFEIQDGGRRHLENRFFWPLLINRLSDFSEILYEEEERHADKSYRTKIALNRHISVKNFPIFMKFGTLHQILKPVTVTWPKLKFLKLKMAVTAILKIVFLAITHRPIVRFRRNFVCGSRKACRQRPHDKNCKFFKSKTADGRHFENRYIAIS